MVKISGDILTKKQSSELKAKLKSCGLSQQGLACFANVNGYKISQATLNNIIEFKQKCAPERLVKLHSLIKLYAVSKQKELSKV